ncbi:hypothetical protein FYK55_04445 [Roseiconus nitratireducens]|uniref:Uncharacterized protein n=1 Tax=Roseiconus nitratireducens TaxID=2605748 RepID=A0A5M6DF09_9BACT|nr:hypothetical protein [Roseiconus nitratireducens]KAA5546151.1 hypothetical protein FYK55_04445 [Roseiconus nitratireducens]
MNTQNDLQTIADTDVAVSVNALPESVWRLPEMKRVEMGHPIELRLMGPLRMEWYADQWKMMAERLRRVFSPSGVLTLTRDATTD